MRKIYGIITAILWGTSLLLAQSPVNRTVKTTVADVLAQMIVARHTVDNELWKELAATGKEGVLLLIDRLKVPDKENGSIVKDALNGLTEYVKTEGNEAVRVVTVQGYTEGLEKVTDPELKAFIIGQLQEIGKDESVDVLAGYLDDGILSGPAAHALAAIRSEKAGKALLVALAQRTGTPATQKDLLMAVAETGAEGAEEVVRKYAGSSDPEIQKSVWHALGRVGSEISLKDLADATARTGYSWEETGATEAYVGLMKRIAGQGQVAVAEKAAKDLLKNATKAGKQQTRIAALEILFSTESAGTPDKKTNHTKWVLEALKDSDRKYRNAALNFASGYANREMYVEVIKAMMKAEPDVKVDILNWIGREAEQPSKHDLIRDLDIRFDLPAKQVLIAQLDDKRKGDKEKEGDEKIYAVKEAAAWTLVKIGDPSFIPVLAHLLENGEKRIVLLAQNALAAFPGDIDAAVAKAIPAAGNAGKIAGLELLAMRHATANINTVLEQIKSDSPEVKAAAYVALKDVVGERDLVNLCGMLETADALAVPPLQRAVISSLSGMPVEKQIGFLRQRMLQAGEGKKPLYDKILASIGDKEASGRVGNELDTDPEIQQKAVEKRLDKAPAEERFQLSPQEQKEGFQVLFDGTNMNEWMGNTVDYVCEDGCISLIPSKSFGGNLYTRKEYANFIYRFEFQLTPAANNGVGIRTPLEGDAAYVGMEIQILDCEHPVYKDITPLQHHGSVYGIIPAQAHASKPAGEWNTEEIRAEGDHIRVTVNGIVILDGNIREAVKNGTPDGKEHPGLFNKKGHIGFLGHGSSVRFRNIRIKELE